MLYVANHLAAKPLKKLENIIIGNLYRHPSMKLNDFNENFLDPLMEALSTEDKSVYLMGDFNIDLTKIDIDNNTSIFFDSMTSNLFVPHITHPTRVTLTTKLLIDNIFSNSSNFTQGISGNITLTISDPMAQFLFIPEDKQTIPEDTNIYKRDYRNFDKD